MGMVDMHGGAQIVIEGLHLGEAVDIIERRQPGIRKGLRDKEKDRRCLRQDAPIRDQRGHPALGVDGEIVGLRLRRVREINLDGLIIGTGLGKGDMRGEGDGSGREEKFEHL